MTHIFKTRADAGRMLAARLEKFRQDNPVILALPRGGVPLAFEIARALNAPLDVILVRKIPAPMSPELAAGAVVDGENPQIVLNDEIVRLYKIKPDYIADRASQQIKEIERRRKLYRHGEPALPVNGRTVIVVDDGIATGATMRAALRGLKKQNPAKIIMAVPVAPVDTLAELSADADEIICLETPEPFYAVGNYYRDFTQVTDERVIDFMSQVA